MKRVLVIVFVVALSVWAALFLTSTRDDAEGNAVARDGSQVDVIGDPGAPMTVIHFWGTWCAPCRDELPDLAEFRHAFEGKGISFVMVADDPDFATVDQFLKKQGISFDAMLIDPRGAAARGWNVHAYPTTFVVGPGNEMLAVYEGMVDWTSPLERREILRLGGLAP